MNSNNRLIIAAAGSGKTTCLVNQSLGKENGKVLITTYTRENEEAIRKKFIKINKCIPDNVIIQTWFSFLIQHGVRPFQGCMGLSNFDCSGLLLVNSQSTEYVRESEVRKYYFSSSGKIYSDKLSKFVVRSEEASHSIINRLSRIYTDIFIDEVQDLAGYDLDFLKLLFQSPINIILIGDPRQVTYLTHHEARYGKYKDGKIEEFIRDECKKIFDPNGIDSHSLIKNYRSCSLICNLSDKLYPNLGNTSSASVDKTEHDGVFLIKKSDVESYLLKYNPTQLRDSVRTKGINENYNVTTFGRSKGLEFDRVLIFPTVPFVEWLKDNNKELKSISRSKLYVAITRARYSVGIVFDDILDIDGVKRFEEMITP
jgi:DNA helicase-2/ATP-dependent DNA helicase PcrA